LASWIRKHRNDVSRHQLNDDDDEYIRRNHVGGDVNDGCQCEPPEGIDPLDCDAFLRLRSIFWADLHEAGMPLRKIASLFRVDKNLVARAISQIPDSILVGRRPGEKYFDNLRDVVASNPRSLRKLIELAQRKAGTFGLEHFAFRGAGIHRASVETILGRPRKFKAKETSGRQASADEKPLGELGAKAAASGRP
jgi:hypothetical protein